MRKLLSSTILLGFLIFILWVVTGWYYGSKLENTLKENYQNYAEKGDLENINLVLLRYKRTLLGANVKFQLSFNYPILGQQLNEIEINAKVLNGPIFINESGISLGKEHWTFRINESSLDYDSAEFFKELFPETLPKLNAIIDYNDEIHYHLKTKTSLAEVLLTGVYIIASKENRTAVTLKKLKVAARKMGFSAENILLSVQHQAMGKTHIPEKVSIYIPDLEIKDLQLKEKISLAVKVNSHIFSKKEKLNGYLKVLLKNKDINQIPVNSADLSLHFNKLPKSELLMLSKVNAQISNLYQQVDWVLAETSEYPEGRDHLWEIYDDINSLSKKRSKILVSNLGSKEGQLYLEGKLKEVNGVSSLKGALKPSLKYQRTNSLFSLLRGEADVNITNNLYKYLSTRIGLKQKQFKLVFEDNKLLIHQ